MKIFVDVSLKTQNNEDVDRACSMICQELKRHLEGADFRVMSQSCKHIQLINDEIDWQLASVHVLNTQIYATIAAAVHCCRMKLNFIGFGTVRVSELEVFDVC